MYESYFGLAERPFSIAPDPQYLYMSSRHKEAMAHLSYGLSQGGGFIVLTGEVGTGKTTLCRNLLSDVPDNVDIALILNASINELELLQSLSDELGIKYKKKDSQKQLLDVINTYLLDAFAKNRQTVLIIDEAQLLSRDVLEQIRLLTNLETTKTKLLQIILIGQPELNTLLSRDDLRQLAQRVTARYHLSELRLDEIEEYVNFRLGVAGCKQPVFSRQALNKLHSLTQGIPRKINVLADHTLLAAYSKSLNIVDAKTVTEAANDVFITRKNSAKTGLLEDISRWWPAVSLAALLNIGLWWWFSQSMQSISSSATSTTVEDAIAVEQNETIEPENIDAVSNPQNQKPAAPISPKENDQLTEYQSGGSVQIAENPLKDITEPESLAVQQNQTQTSSNATLTNTAQHFVNVLETSADKTGRINAFRVLATVWGKTLPDIIIRNACTEVAAQDLRCLAFSDWSEFLAYNRPAILVLSYNSRFHRVVVESILDDEAIVLIGDARHEVPISTLQRMWTKKGVVFWRPEIRPVPLRQGNYGIDVVNAKELLNRTLVKLDLPLIEDVNNPSYNVQMAQKVFLLQNRYSLKRDDAITEQTYLLLNEVLFPETTRILQPRS